MVSSQASCCLDLLLPVATSTMLLARWLTSMVSFVFDTTQIYSKK